LSRIRVSWPTTWWVDTSQFFSGTLFLSVGEEHRLSM
jgi:hypothetical protein